MSAWVLIVIIPHLKTGRWSSISGIFQLLQKYSRIIKSHIAQKIPSSWTLLCKTILMHNFILQTLLYYYKPINKQENYINTLNRSECGFYSRTVPKKSEFQVDFKFWESANSDFLKFQLRRNYWYYALIFCWFVLTMIRKDKGTVRQVFLSIIYCNCIMQLENDHLRPVLFFPFQN